MIMPNIPMITITMTSSTKVKLDRVSPLNLFTINLFQGPKDKDDDLIKTSNLYGYTILIPDTQTYGPIIFIIQLIKIKAGRYVKLILCGKFVALVTFKSTLKHEKHQLWLVSSPLKQNPHFSTRNRDLYWLRQAR